MSLRLRLVRLLVVMTLVSGCTTEQQRTDRAVARLVSAADAFKMSRSRYPRSLVELQAFAVAAPLPETLDLQPFTEVTFTTYKDGSLGMMIGLKSGGPDHPGIVLVRASSVSTGCGSIGPAKR